MHQPPPSSLPDPSYSSTAHVHPWRSSLLQKVNFLKKCSIYLRTLYTFYDRRTAALLTFILRPTPDSEPRGPGPSRPLPRRDLSPPRPCHASPKFPVSCCLSQHMTNIKVIGERVQPVTVCTQEINSVNGRESLN